MFSVLKDWLRSQKRMFKRAVMEGFDLVVEDKYAELKFVDDFSIPELVRICRREYRKLKNSENFLIFLVSKCRHSSAVNIYEITSKELLQIAESEGQLFPGKKVMYEDIHALTQVV